MGIFDIFKKNKTTNVSSKNSSLTTSSYTVNDQTFKNSNTPFDSNEEEAFSRRIGVPYCKVKEIVGVNGVNPSFIGLYSAYDTNDNKYAIWIYKGFVVIWPFECKEIPHYEFLSKRYICENPNTFFLRHFVHSLNFIKELINENKGGIPVTRISYIDSTMLPQMWTEEKSTLESVYKYIKQSLHKNKDGDDGFFYSLYSVNERQIKQIILGDTHKEEFEGIKSSDNSTVRLYCLGSSLFAITDSSFTFENIKFLFLKKPYDKRLITQHVLNAKKIDVKLDETITIKINNNSYVFPFGKNSFLYNYFSKEEGDSSFSRFGFSESTLINRVKNNSVIGLGYSELNKDIYEIILLDNNTFIVSKLPKGIADVSEFKSCLKDSLCDTNSLLKYLFTVDDIIEVYSDESINSYHYVKNPNALSAAIGGSLFGSAYALGELLDTEESSGTFKTGSLHVVIKNLKTTEIIKISLNISSKEVYYYFYSIIL